jgi:Spy/CpxP family protein refolding chaperone
MNFRALILGSALVIGASSIGSAQRGESSSARPLRPRAAARVEKGLREGKGGGAQGAVAGNQQALARQLRQAFAGVVRKRLNLNDDQARQLNATERRFNQQRNAVLQSERQARLGLKAAMQDSSGTRDQAKIDQYMNQLVQAQHRRADILEAEQKEMSGYLTPFQRAQYQALHEQLLKRVNQMRQGAPPTP